MGADVVAVSVVSAFWAVVAFILPFILGRGPNKGVIQSTLMLSGISCWLFWFLCYVHQMNPLIGPEMHHTTVFAVKYLWDDDATFLNYTNMTSHTPIATTVEVVKEAATTAASTALN